MTAGLLIVIAIVAVFALINGVGIMFIRGAKKLNETERERMEDRWH